jgi:hypothetical protein
MCILGGLTAICFYLRGLLPGVKTFAPTLLSVVALSRYLFLICWCDCSLGVLVARASVQPLFDALSPSCIDSFVRWGCCRSSDGTTAFEACSYQQQRSGCSPSDFFIAVELFKCCVHRLSAAATETSSLLCAREASATAYFFTLTSGSCGDEYSLLNTGWRGEDSRRGPFRTPRFACASAVMWLTRCCLRVMASARHYRLGLRSRRQLASCSCHILNPFW